MNDSAQDLLQLAPTASAMSLIGSNRTTVSTSWVDLCYLMPSPGAPALTAQMRLRAQGCNSHSQLKPWEFSTLDSPMCRKDDSSILNHKQVLVMTHRAASRAVEINWNFSKH